MLFVGVKLVGHTAKFSKMTAVAYGREMNIEFSGNISGGHSCSQHANCTLPQLETPLCLIVLCDRTAHFRVAFYYPQRKVHLCNDHAVLISFLICHTCQVDGLSWQRRNAH